jgi:hypothetical protein
MVLSSRSSLARLHELIEQICTVSITHDGRANDFWHLECCRCLIELVVIVKNVLEILNAIDENRVRCNARIDSPDLLICMTFCQGTNGPP